jgi:hypothetical protein
MIRCKLHGLQAGMCIAREALDSEGRVSPGLELVRVDFEWDRTPTHWFFMTKEIADRLRVTPGPMELPDVFPPWVNETEWACVCDKCFIESGAIANLDRLPGSRSLLGPN